MTTPKAKLPELSLTTAQQATVVNSDLSIIDQGIDGTVKSRGVNTPPGSPVDGDAYIVGSSPTGSWAGKANQIAFWRDPVGAWQFMIPLSGWTRRVQDDLDTAGIPKEYGYTGSAWALPAGAGGSFTGGTLTSALNEAPIVSIASASTVAIGAAAANTISVTGTTTITAFDTIASGAKRVVVFAGILTLTYNATSMILPTAASITTAAGDVAEFVSRGGGNWTCTSYMRANGQPIAGGGGGLANWTDSVSTTSPNASTPVAALSGTNAATNVDVAIVPKGSGGLAAAVADGTATSGNKRGSQAVDWQRARSSATQVASSQYSVISGGQNNTSSNTGSAVGGGQSNIASGQNATVPGGTTNTASSTGSTVGGGSSNTSSGNNATVGGGTNNTADGLFSTIAGGSSALTRGIIGAEAYASGTFSTPGDAQRERFIMRRSTSDATSTVLTTNNGAPSTNNIPILPANSTYGFTGSIVARNGNTDQARWTIDGLISRGALASSVALVGTANKTKSQASAGASAWDVAISADTTNGAIQVAVTGAASTNIKWVLDLQTNEVSG